MVCSPLTHCAPIVLTVNACRIECVHITYTQCSIISFGFELLRYNSLGYSVKNYPEKLSRILNMKIMTTVETLF